MSKQESLNEQQKEVVQHTSGPMLVVAGAGTGKTRVIVERINRLINEGTPPKRILALTFTEKAAVEMLDRANELAGTYYLELPIMTFNSFGEGLLRRYGADIGLGRNFALMGESAQIVFLREHLDELGLDYFAPVSRPDSQLGALRDYFSKLKQLVITPDIYDKFVDSMPTGDDAEKLEKTKNKELAEAYKAYASLCQENSVIDFDDQIYGVIELFKKRPNVLKAAQKSYDYIMVDEFQDTNLMQSTLVDMLVGEKQNLLVVGDDDQSIYGFRGANLSNILDFKKRYPGSREVTLIENYRSTKEILAPTYELIQANNPNRLEAKLKIDKRLKTTKSGPEPLQHIFETLAEELDWLASDIRNHLKKGVPASDIAVLARSNATVKLIDDILTYRDVEHVVAGQRYELYHEPIVRTLLEALKTVVNPDNNISLYHVLTGPLFSISPSDLTTALAKCRREHETLKKTLEETANRKTADALALIEAWREDSGLKSVGALSYQILDSSGLKETLFENARQDATSATSVMRLNELFSTMKEFELIAGNPSAVQYVDALPALIAAGNSGEDGTLDLSGDAVNVLTVHKAKGLEWQVVYIVNCAEQSFPLYERSHGINLPDRLREQYYSEADEHIPEERRLMYVAMTRARSHLVLTFSNHHSSPSLRRPSRFLNEAFSGSSDNVVNHSPEKTKARDLDIFRPNTPGKIQIPDKILSGEQVSLTVSQIDDYLRCPLNFYFKHVLKAPEEPSPSRDYGSIMHKVIEDINRGLMAGEPINQAELVARLNTEWPRVGYSSKIQRERALKQGLLTLDQIVKRALEVPIAVEEPFRISLDDIKLSMRGQFDAVFPLEKGVEIRDYKTSTSVDTPERAKVRAGDSKQLTLYALAWQILHDELPGRVTLDFIDTGMRGSIGKTQKGIDGMKDRLKKVADGIRGYNFPLGSEKHDFCIHPENS